MSLFGYEKPSLKEITADELRSFGVAMLSGGGGGGGSSSGGGSTGGGSSTPSTDSLAECLFEQVGFSYKRNAGYVYWLRMLSNKLNAVYGSLDAEERAWMFFRIVGGFCYGSNDKWLAKSGWFEDLKWSQTAGVLPYESGDVSTPPSGELSFFVKKLGFDEKSYRLFRYYTRAQHVLCGNESSDLDKKRLKDALGDCFTSSDRWLETGGAITDAKSLDALSEVLKSNMVGKVDFAHMCITVASMLATDCAEAGGPGSVVYTYFSSQFPRLCSAIDPDTAREYMAGWLGDAVLLGNDNKTSFGGDDYRADLDAIDVAPRIRRRSTALGAMEECFSSGQSRRSRFLSKISAADALAYMNRGVFQSDEVSDESFLETISESDQYVDTYRFYRILTWQADEL